MTDRPATPHARTLAAALAMTTALPLAAHAQTVCGSWERVASFLGTRVSDMVVYDDGTGEQFYVGGWFTSVSDPVGGWIDGPYLVRWDGVTWSGVPGLDGSDFLDARVIDVEVFDDGTGPALYVAGDFVDGAGLVANGLARWDSTAWSVLGDPATAGLWGRVHDVQPHDDGDGVKLYIAGTFHYPDFSNAPNIFVWDGATWAPAGDNAPDGDTVYGLTSFGGELFASGPFDFDDGESRSGIIRLEGDTWSVPASVDQRISSQEFWPLQPWTIDGRDVLVAAGRFTVLEGGAALATNIAAWDGSRWDALPGLELGPPLDAITCLTVFDDGGGEALFIGGASSRSGGDTVYRWKDGRFGPAAGLTRTTPFALGVFDDGEGPALYAGGEREAGLFRWRPAPCAADLTGDCTLDLFDFLEFQNLFDAGDPAADFDGDGELTIFDFLAYQNVFDAGCV